MRKINGIENTVFFCTLDAIPIYVIVKKLCGWNSNIDFLTNMDYGAFENLPEVADYLRNDILVAVCGAKPSEVALVTDILRVDNGTMHYIFSFVPQRDREDIIQSMEQFGERTYFAGWTPDYFLYAGNDELYSCITGQSKSKSTTVQKKHNHGWLFRRGKK